MTVPATARRAGPFSGNGVTTTFSFSFKTFAAGDLLVTLTSNIGIETALVLDSHYSVSLNVDQDASPGGTITYPISGSPLPSGYKLTITGDLEYEQTTDLLGGGAFNARVIEDTFDRTVIQIQQLEERVDRAMTLPVSVSGASAVLPSPEANKFLGWNGAATAIVNRDGSDLVTVAAYGNWRTDVFNGTGAQVNFVLTQDPGNVNNTDVSINGVTQTPGVDYTVSGTTLTFTIAPPVGTGNVVARYGLAIPAGITDANLVTYLPAGIDAEPTTVQAKLREIVSPEDFGAVGDGIADDTAPITNALQYCSDTGVPFKAKGGATYRMAIGGTVTRTNGKPMLVDWAGATVVCDESSGVIFGSAPTAFLNTTLATEIDRGDAFIHLTSVAGIAKGDLLEVLSPALTNGSVSTYHYYVVNEIDGNNVYIEGTTVADVKAQQIIDSGQTGSITVAVFKVAPMLVVQNATFEMVNTTGASYFSIYVRGHNKAIINNVTFTGKGRFQLGVDYTGFIDVGGCTFRDFGYVELNSGYTNLPSAPGGQSFGYGFLTTRNYETLFHDCFGLRGWHTIDASRGAMQTQVSNCFFDRNAFGVSSHEGAWYVIVKDCVFDGNNGATLSRAIYTTVENCEFRNLSEHGIVYGGEMVEVRVANNRFAYNPGVVSTFSAVRNANELSATTPKAGAVSTGFQRVFELVGNTILGQCRCQAGFNGDTSGSGRLVVSDNTFDNVGAFTVSAMQHTAINGNNASRLGSQFFFTLSASGTMSVAVTNNTHAGGVGIYSGSAMTALTGSGTPLIYFANNSCRGLQYFLRFNSNITVYSVVNCYNDGERLFLNAGTVTNAINNYYGNALSDGVTTVTNSVNNQNLA